MKRKKLNAQFENVLKSAKRLADLEEARAVVVLAEEAYSFKSMKKILRGVSLIVASEDEDIQQAVIDDEIAVIPLEHEPQTRGTQVSQMLLEAIADELLQSGDVVVAVYPSYEKGVM